MDKFLTVDDDFIREFKLNRYYKMLTLLKNKYGLPPYDYIEKGNSSKCSKHGQNKPNLFIHHDLEIKEPALSSKESIEKFIKCINSNDLESVFVKGQERENLTYANQFEHLALHIVITTLQVFYYKQRYWIPNAVYAMLGKVYNALQCKYFIFGKTTERMLPILETYNNSVANCNEIIVKGIMILNCIESLNEDVDLSDKEIEKRENYLYYFRESHKHHYKECANCACIALWSDKK